MNLSLFDFVFSRGMVSFYHSLDFFRSKLYRSWTEQSTRVGPTMAPREEAHWQHPTPAETPPLPGLQSKRTIQRHPQPRPQSLHFQRTTPHLIKSRVPSRNAVATEAPSSLGQHQRTVCSIHLQHQQPRQIHRNRVRQHTVSSPCRSCPSARQEAQQVYLYNSRFPIQNG